LKTFPNCVLVIEKTSSSNSDASSYNPNNKLLASITMQKSCRRVKRNMSHTLKITMYIFQVNLG